MYDQDMYNRPQMNVLQQPYGYNMNNTLPSPMGGVSNSSIPSLYPSMMTPNLNKQAFMPSDGDMGGKPSYKQGGLAHLPRFKKGGLGKFIRKAAGLAAPFVGGALGGPGGAALGGALGGALQGKKNMLRNAALGAGLGYAGSGGFGNLGGFGKVIPGVNAGFSGLMSGQGMGGFQGLSGLFGGGGGGAGTGAAGAGMGGIDLNSGLLGLATLAALGAKKRVPYEQPFGGAGMGASGMGQGAGQDRRVKPTERIQRIMQIDEDEDGTPEKQYFEDVNPPVQYMAHGGYLDGDTGGQDDAIKARLADGEYVISADVVSALGDGNNKNGAKKFDTLMQKVRSHKYAKGGRGLPPKAKSLESYMQSRRSA